MLNHIAEGPKNVYPAFALCGKTIKRKPFFTLTGCRQCLNAAIDRYNEIISEEYS